MNLSLSETYLHGIPLHHLPGASARNAADHHILRKVFLMYM